MSRLQQGISKLNNLSNHSGGGASGISRLTSPSSIAGSNGNGKNFDDLKRQIHSKLVERLDFTRVRDLSSDAMSRHSTRPMLLAALALLVLALPASAADAPSSAPLFAGYWSSFIEHWGNYFKKQNGVIMAALGLGAVSLFIITRGKWKK